MSTTALPVAVQRRTVVSTSCSGKPTFAKSLAAQLQVLHIEFDALHWRRLGPGSARRLLEGVASATSAERWASDGNYSVVRDLIWGRATALIWLDYPSQQ